MRRTRLLGLALVMGMATAAGDARAECDCVSVAADVPRDLRDVVVRADNLYAAGEYGEALELYADAHARGGAAVLLYAMAQCHRRLGNHAEARAKLEAYLEAGAAGSLTYGARAKAALGALPGAGAAGKVTGGVGRVAGKVTGRADDDLDAAGAGVVAGAGSAAGAGVGAAGGLADTAKPRRIAKTPAIILGVVAVAAVGVVGVQSLRAGFSDEIDFDKKLNLSLGLSGAVMGGTAIYLWGLTAAAGATAGAGCPGLADGSVITPFVHRDGAGLAAHVTF